MSAKPQTIAVFGSTGIQGASVLHYLLAHPPAPNTSFRAITQSPPSSSLPHLPSTSEHPNITVHQVDLLKPPTILAALEGSTIVFGTTNSNSPQFLDKRGTESQAVRNLIDACVQSGGVELLVLSTLPPSGESGKFSADFREKSQGLEYARKVSKETGLKMVFVELGWYYNNFITFHPPKVNKDDGVVEFDMPGADPKVKGPWVASYQDFGPAVKGIIDNPTPYLGKEIFLVGEFLSLEDIARDYTEVTGQQSRVVNLIPIVDPAQMASITGSATDREWAYVSGVYNAGAYGEGLGPDLGEELLKKVEGRGYLTFKEWLIKIGLDAKKEGLGIEKLKEKWGGRVFF